MENPNNAVLKLLPVEPAALLKELHNARQKAIASKGPPIPQITIVMAGGQQYRGNVLSVHERLVLLEMGSTERFKIDVLYLDIGSIMGVIVHDAVSAVPLLPTQAS